MMADYSLANLYCSLEADNDEYDELYTEVDKVGISVADKIMVAYSLIANSANSEVLHERIDAEEAKRAEEDELIREKLIIGGTFDSAESGVLTLQAAKEETVSNDAKTKETIFFVFISRPPELDSREQSASI